MFSALGHGFVRLVNVKAKATSGSQMRKSKKYTPNTLKNQH
jgi:hypothetical protein